MVDTTTNFYLRDIAKDLGIKVSIIMRDELLSSTAGDELDQRSASPKLHQIFSSGQSPDREKDNLIINLQKHNEKGSHWILANGCNISFEKKENEIFKYIFNLFRSYNNKHTFRDSLS